MCRAMPFRTSATITSHRKPNCASSPNDPVINQVLPFSVSVRIGNACGDPPIRPLFEAIHRTVKDRVEHLELVSIKQAGKVGARMARVPTLPRQAERCRTGKVD